MFQLVSAATAAYATTATAKTFAFHIKTVCAETYIFGTKDI